MNNTRIIINGEGLSGWSEIKISKSIKSLADTFTFTFSDSWVDEFPDLLVGTPCKVKDEDDLLLTGFIEQISIISRPNLLSYKIVGRSRTGDIVDCNRIDPPYSWINRNILQIAKDLCSPFNIDVEVETDIGEPFPKEVLDQNEGIVEFLQKLALKRGLILTTSPQGNLVITNAGRVRSEKSFIEGTNISDLEVKFSYADRYSFYRMKAQSQSIYNENSWGRKTIQVFADTIDENVERFRPKLLTSDTSLNKSSAQKQVNWEAQIRAGRSTQFKIKNPEW